MMRSLAALFGRFLFWLFNPIFRLVFNNSHRVRLVIYDGKKLLVVRNWVGDGRWGLPGGGILRGESNEAAVLREAHEETGLKSSIDTLILLGPKILNEKGYHYTNHYYGLRYKEVQTLRARREIMEVAWLEPSELTSSNAWQDALMGASLVEKL